MERSAGDADDVVRRGTRVATVAVNKPKDPDEPEPETPAPKGPGLDQNRSPLSATSCLLSRMPRRTVRI